MATQRRRGKGEGSITQRKDGRWVASVDYGWIGGKRVRPQKTCATKTEAIRELRKLQAVQDRGILPDAVTVETWLRYWIEQVADVRPRTRTTYKSMIETWLIPLAGPVQIRKLTPEHVRAIHRRMEEAGRSKATIRHAHIILKTALDVALAEERISRNVARIVKPPKAPKNPHHTLTLDAVRRLIEVASGRELVRLTLALLGLRQGEALGLRWRDVIEGDDGSMALTVAEQVQWIEGKRVRRPLKSAASVRSVGVPTPWSQMIAGWRMVDGGDPDSYILGEISPYVDARQWSALLARAGVEHVPLHGARGTVSTAMERQGVPARVIADILGHSDVRVTNAHYLHSDSPQRLAALQGIADSVQP